MSAQDFASAAGETFDVGVGAASVVMTLTKVTAMPARSNALCLRDPFSLTFRSCSAVILPQRIYQMRNARTGTVGVFLVPVAKDREGIVYQAIFN